MENIWTSSSGRIEFKLSLEQAAQGSHSGACDSDIADLLAQPDIAAQLAAISPQLIADELGEYGAWDSQELSNHADNLARLLWIACGDTLDNQFNEEN